MKVISELRPFLPPALLDDAGWQRLFARVQDLPAYVPEYCGFEFRLGVEEAAADLFVAAEPDLPIGRHFIAQGESAPATSPPGALARHLRALADADSALREVVDLTGLEYDVAEVPADERPPPGVFFKLHQPLRPDSPAAQRERALASLAAAVGWDGGDDLGSAVERTLASLPPASAVDFIGALPGRSLHAVRLIVDRIEHGEAAATLKRLGWDGAAEAAARLLDELRPVLPRFRFALDVLATGVLPRIGFELFAKPTADQFDSWLTTTSATWRPVVAELVERGWCRPAKAAALLDWCALERLYDDKGMAVLQRGINHIKLTLLAAAPHEQPTAKAYGGVLYARPT